MFFLKVDQDEILGSPKDKESSKLIDDNQREPSDKTAAITSWAVLAITVIFVCLSALLIWGTDALSRHEAWAIFLVCLLSGLLLGNTILILRQPQNRTPLPFMVPCVPLLPLTSIFINIFLMMKLSYLTWIRFVVWMIIGEFHVVQRLMLIKYNNHSFTTFSRCVLMQFCYTKRPCLVVWFRLQSDILTKK